MERSLSQLLADEGVCEAQDSNQMLEEEIASAEPALSQGNPLD